MGLRVGGWVSQRPGRASLPPQSITKQWPGAPGALGATPPPKKNSGVVERGSKDHNLISSTRMSENFLPQLADGGGGGGKGGEGHQLPGAADAQTAHPATSPAQPQHTNDWAPRTRKRHQQEHRPQRPTERSDPTQHAKGRTGDCPGPRKETTTRRNVTQGGGGIRTADNHRRSDTVTVAVTVPVVWSWNTHEKHGNKRAGRWRPPPGGGGGGAVVEQGL